MKVKRKSIQQFISDLVQHCIKSDVELKFLNKTKVPLNGLFCNGYFEGGEEKGKLFIATKKPQIAWLPILVHESCHLDQWLENKKKFNEGDGVELIDKWINGGKVNKTKLLAAIKLTKKVELDCEKRSVEKIKKYKLPINVETYIQMSNTYVYFYNWVLENRKWIKSEKTLFIKEIYSLAPKEFQSNYNKTPEALNEAFNNYLQ